MRVMQLTQYLALGGLERCVVNIAIGLSQQGHHSMVVAYEPDGLNASFVDELRQNKVDLTVLQKPHGFSVRTLFSLLVITLSRRVDIIHSHDLGALIYATLVSLLSLRRVRVIHTQHSFVHFKKNKSRYRIYEKIFARLTHDLCVVSQPVFEQYEKLGICRSRIILIPNGIAFPDGRMAQSQARRHLTQQSAGRDHQREHFSFSRDKRIVLTLGRVARGKGIERMMQLWQRLKPITTQGWQWVHVGPVSDPAYGQLLSTLSPHGETGPFFVGPSDQPYLFYQAADVFVSLSEEEGMPLAVYEAIGFGLPVLLSDIPAHRTLAVHAQILPSGSEQPVVAAFERFLDDPRATCDPQTAWVDKAVFRQKHSVMTMVRHYVRRYGIQLDTLIVCIFALGCFYQQSVNGAEPRITSLLERPEYLMAEDWQDELSLSVAPGESAMLTLKAGFACGALPRLSDNLVAAGVQIRWFGGVSVPVVSPSYEGATPGQYIEALVPVSDDIPCTDVPAVRYEWLFADVSVEKGAQPEKVKGVLNGTFHTETSAASTVHVQWKLEVEILKFELPDMWSLPLRSELTPYFAALAHYGRSGPEEGELTRRYVRAMAEHRILPLKAWIKHPFQNATERREENFKITMYPSKELSIAHTVLSQIPVWSRIDIPRFDHPEMDEQSSYWQRWADFLRTGSDDVHESNTIERFNNRPFTYLWDEPTQADLYRMNSIAKVVNRVAPEISPLVTVYPWPSLQDHIRIFVPLLQRFIHEGIPVIAPGNELWSYVSCMSHGCGSDFSSGEPDFVIERNAAYVRVWPWMADKYALSGVLYYSVNNIFGQATRRDPWTDMFDFSGNGDGTLFLPGRPGMHGLTQHEPIATLRLKFWRQSSFDYEYIKHAREKTPECFGKVKERFALVSNAVAWVRNPRAYQKAREHLIGCLAVVSDSQPSGG